jgi:hypothetical protein
VSGQRSSTRRARWCRKRDGGRGCNARCAPDPRGVSDRPILSPRTASSWNARNHDVAASRARSTSLSATRTEPHPALRALTHRGQVSPVVTVETLFATPEARINSGWTRRSRGMWPVLDVGSTTEPVGRSIEARGGEIPGRFGRGMGREVEGATNRTDRPAQLLLIILGSKGLDLDRTRHDRSR